MVIIQKMSIVLMIVFLLKLRVKRGITLAFTREYLTLSKGEG